jgi:hypothetical protein
MSAPKRDREAILKELALIEEKKRRARIARPPYKPRPGQLQVLSCTAKNIFNFSGNGGGKTAINVQLAMAFARGYNQWTGEKTRVPAQVAFVVDTSRKIEDRVIPEFKKWFDLRSEQFHKDGRPYTARISLDNGSEINFLTADAEPMTMEGVEYSAVIVDEPFPRPLYVALKRSLRIKGHPCKFIFSGTAISQAWLRKEIFEPWRKGELPDTMCFNLKTEDNRENLADGYIEGFSNALSEAEKKVRLDGGFFDADTMALAEHFNPDVHVVKRSQFAYDYRMPCVVAIDPHSTKPHTAIMLAIGRDNKAIAIKELAFKGNAMQFAPALKEWEKGYNVVDRVCDSFGNTPSNNSAEGVRTFIEGLIACDVMVRPTTFADKSHEDLIDRLRQGLALPIEADQFGRRTPALRVHEDCPKLISDIETVGWQRNRMTGEVLPKLDTSQKDHLSCLGYALAVAPAYDIMAHSAPRYRTESLPQAAPVRREIEAHRKRVIQGRAARARSRFFRRITGA